MLNENGRVDTAVGWDELGEWDSHMCSAMYGQGGLACCNSWGCEELDTTERLN